MLPLLRLSLLLLAGVGLAAAQAYLDGVVRVRTGDELSPLEGARVEARAGTPPVIIAAARSDSMGRYRLDGLPAGRIETTVHHPRHYVIRAGEVENERLTLSCPESGSCGEVDFLLERTLVLEGWVVDPWGDPVAWVEATLLPADNADQSPSGRRRTRSSPFRVATDDRGYFRIHTLEPGEYSVELSVPPPHRLPFSADPIPLRVEPGIDPAPLHVTMRAGGERGFRLSGAIEGIEISPENPATLAFVPDSSQWGGQRGFGLRTEILTSDRFELRLPGGDYVVYANPIPAAGSLQGASGSVLGKMRVDADRAQLVLRPQPTGTLRGRVTFDDTKPEPIHLWFRPLDDRGVAMPVSVRPPSYEFELTSMLPGRYAVAGTRDLFVVGRPEVVVPGRGTAEIDIVVSSNFAELSGLVRVAEENENEDQAAHRTGAHYTVAIRSGSLARSASADQQGRFRFERLRPGEYEVCAWSEPSIRVSDSLWKEAGAAVRRFALEAGDQTEIVLTAAP